MLQGSALNHYHTNIRPQVPTAQFEDMCAVTQKYFKPPEYQRGLITHWKTVTLGTVMGKPENAGKTTSECLQILLTEMRHLKLNLPTLFRTDEIFYTKLIQACQAIPACTYACCKPAADIL